MDFIEHGLGMRLVLVRLRAERIEEALVFAGGQQAPFDAELFHVPVKPKPSISTPTEPTMLALLT